MGRIKKVAGTKHEATVSPAIVEFVAKASTLPISRLPEHLESFPRRWPFPRGDLYHWISLLNRFDAILDQFNSEYGLNAGSQTRPLGRILLERGVAEESKAATVTGTKQAELESLGFESDGDRQMVEVILEFSRILLENCGNRSLYNSSERLGDLLNTISLSLLSTTLQLAVRLAQRYHASRQRGVNANQHLNNALLASHYNVDLEKVQKLANPFVKLPSSQPFMQATTPSAKGKEKAHVPQGLSTSTTANDMLALARENQTSTNGSIERTPTTGTEKHHGANWEDWSGILLTYYQPSTTPKEDQKPPSTPTPSKRTSGLSRPSRLSSSDDTMESSSPVVNAATEDSTAAGMKHLEIPSSKILTSPAEEILQENMEKLPKESRYEFLTRLRVAKAISRSLSTRQEIIGIRLLAITNLAYIYPEATFQQKILQPDSDEPRRLQLAYQLADLVHPPGNGQSGIPAKLQTVALGALEALAKHKAKAPDVCAALNINVNHGVLFYILRKTLADMATEDADHIDIVGDDRREAVFSLLDSLPASAPRTGETLIAAGLLDILIDVLNLRTLKAERNHPKVLTFLNTLIYTVRDALQILANAKGLETISDLIAYEVQSSLKHAREGNGVPTSSRNQLIDYQIPFFQQQTLRMLFRIINHMMSHSSGNFDRLLRNLIDSPQLLSGLRTVIENANVFGNSVWTGAVNIMSSFIHNEPTSYAIISEAGLSKGLLEAISSKPMDSVKDEGGSVGPEPNAESTAIPNQSIFHASAQDPGDFTLNALMKKFLVHKKYGSPRPSTHVLARGVLPANDAINAIPQAFGAICLNQSGMQMFLDSGALDNFFEIFESPDHVKVMASEGRVPASLGASFDELVRHHPNLRIPVLFAIMNMIGRVTKLCELQGNNVSCGARLWLQGDNGQLIAAGEESSKTLASADMPTAEEDADVVMGEASQSGEAGSKSPTSPSKTVSPGELKDTEDEKNGPMTSTFIEMATKFVAGFCDNNTLCAIFAEASGAEMVLDLATLPSLQYDFNNHAASSEVARAVHYLAEQKPHLVLPSLLKRTQEAVDALQPLYQYAGEEGFFTEFTSPDRSETSESPNAVVGTTIVRSLVRVQTLCNILYEVFSPPISTRTTHTPFSQINLADMYQNVIKSLGLLHRVCVWEEILLQKRLPDSWKEATKIKGYGMGSQEADEIFGFINNNSNDNSEIADNATGTPSNPIAGDSEDPNGTTTPSTMDGPKHVSLSKDENTAQFRNVRTLRYLLSQIPSCIVPFFQGLGKSLVAKRRPESYLRQNAYMVAQAMSDANLEQLSFEAPRNAASAKDRYAYWIVILTSISQLIIEGSVDQHLYQVLTLVLQAFKNGGGLDAIKDILETFYQEVKAFHASSEDGINVDNGAARLTSAYGGIKIILSLYSQITTSKSIIESTQTLAMTSSDRDRHHAHFFSPQQFLVELRLAILPVVKSLWDSDFVDKASPSIIKYIIDILQTVLEGEDEITAFRRGDEVPARRKAIHRVYTIAGEKIRFLTDKGFDRKVAQEALYRCMNTQNLALEYCQHLMTFPGASRFPIPEYDEEKPRSSITHTPQPIDSSATVSEPGPAPQINGRMDEQGTADQAENDAADGLFLLAQGGRRDDGSARVEIEEADSEDPGSSAMPPPPAPGPPPEDEEEPGDRMQMSLDNLQDILPGILGEMAQAQNLPHSRGLFESGGPSPSGSHSNVQETAKILAAATVDDLDDERATVREKLIERVLDVLNVHDDVTFELRDLIVAAAMKGTDVHAMQGEIGETLIEALISFQMEDDFRSAGKKIASYANLLALVLDNRDFYQASLDCLKEHFSSLLGFIKIFPDQPPDQESPWIAQTLLLIERVLAEDAQPSQIQWTPPGPDGLSTNSNIVAMDPPLVSIDVKSQLFEALLEIMPRIGKDESLVLSVVRTLVILTRSQIIASRLGEKRNIQRLFVMIKQLSGMTKKTLPGSFMILLRHIVEDDDTIRQIMRSEIVGNFETRPGRPTDTLGYVQQMYHLALRSPEIFVEITNEKLQIAKFDKDQRNQVLSLKPEVKETKPIEETALDSTGPGITSNGATERASTPENKPLAGEDDQSTVHKAKPTETKAPIVEQPSGVTHYLLTELLAYKDVDDKDPLHSSKHATAQSSMDLTVGNIRADGSGASTSSPGGPATNTDSDEQKRLEKPEFKAEQHPIYIYRCFILQCLTELLQSYNRSKIEFINFSRKADPKAMTPSKPRSGVLNYMLNDLIPVCTLSHDESITLRKKTNTSNWAMCVIVALCLRTNEAGHDKKPGSIEEDDQTDLLFVRKFVLEHALKAYKDANASSEYPDVKYARLLDIADLFSRLLNGRLVAPGGSASQGNEVGFQKSIAKLMFDKNFLGALTSSIADIDLNFPGSRRAIKYILRPLKQLTSTGIILSETSSISITPGQTDEDEISTASSGSVAGDEREETPDLFRNSTLGMFEPGREEESSSESSGEDDEMYDDEYDEGMEFEDGMERDGEDVISDEDEDLGGAGHIEGLHGDTGMDVEVVIDGDDDDEQSEDDEDEDDSEDMDNEDDIEVIDEISGDDENDSLAGGEDEEWQDEMEEMEEREDGEDYEMEHDLNQDPDAENVVRDIVRGFGGAEAALHRLEGLEDGPSNLQMDIDEGRYMDDVIRRDDDEDDEDEEDEDREDDVDDEDVVYQPEFEDDESGMPDPPWGWEPDDESYQHDHHHHHHHSRYLAHRRQDPWTVFPNGLPMPGRNHLPIIRHHHHRPAGSVRPGLGTDDGTNPLLRRPSRNPTSMPYTRHGRSALSDAAASLSDYYIHGMEAGGPPRNLMADSPVSFVNNVIAAIGQGGPGFTTMGSSNGALHLHIGGGGRAGGSLPRELQAVLGLQQEHPEHTRGSRDEHSQPAIFLYAATFQRWQEEARLLYNKAHQEKAVRVVNSILKLLVPPAIERRKQQEELTKRLKEQEEKLKEERVAREKAEQEEREKREKEEREAAEQRAAIEAAARVEHENHSQGHDDNEEPTETAEGEEGGRMEGVESTQADVSAPEGGEEPSSMRESAEAGPSQPTERIITRLGDREIDITGLGIDLAYLDALPDDIRQEVLMSQIAIQRSQAAASGEPPTEISAEFLEALPAEIREELLQQEAQDRRRREREEARRQQAASGGAPAAHAPEDMDPASFLASLDPILRQHVLAEQDEDMLAHLPEEIAAEARALGGNRTMHRFAGMPGRAVREGGLVRSLLDRSQGPQASAKKPPRKQIVQMLDKAGVATLLRLMFIPQQGSSRQLLNEILRNISDNRQNRAEVISLLLSILQDGSFDVNAVERSFTQLSLRAKQPAAQKTPQSLKSTLTGPIASFTNNMEATPLMVIQQCLTALVYLTQCNAHIPSFFLTEHETPTGMKSKMNRKGKGKETKASKYALNALLSLLDRKLIMESSGCMEQLASLLESVTHPLNMLLKRGKDKSADSKKTGTSADQEDAPVSIEGAANEQSTQEGTHPSEDITAESTSPMADVQVSDGTDQPAHVTTTEAKSDAAQDSEDKETKKTRTLTPPSVPEENLRLVVNIIAARECNGKTFRDAVSTINNLSAIPGARAIFGKGLIEQAQVLGQSILVDLDELVPQMNSAESGTDIQGMALAKFSPASSDQNKLLRVLTALDYVFDPKRYGGKVDEENDAEASAPKDDLLTSLYENSTFGPLWEKLSECLSTIRQGDGMLNIASILQPLVEALMVVCKNTTLKDAPLLKASKDFAITSPAPESRMESLFFKFTEEHRKILNDLVRQNPKLMSGTFSLLVKNPKVLEFDNKRSYFTRRLHSRTAEARHPQPPLQISVCRDRIFLDSFKWLSFKSPDEIKYGKLNIRFNGEEGVDAGGVTREWFQVLSRQMFNPDYALFIPVASDRTTFHPNKLSKVNEEHLMFFKFIGRIIGKALYEGRALDCHFSRAVYKRILGKTVSIKDMETLDLDYYKSLLWMLENDITEIITETFSVETDDFGVTEVVDLVENGRNIPVTEENKQEYVQLVVEYRLTGSVQMQLEKFLEGFHDIVSPELISIFNEQELELLISGLPDIDVDDWKNHTDYHNYQASSPQIQWFWRAVRSFDKEERAKLLQFVTGTSKVPLNGFGQLEGMNGFSRFNIHRDYGNKDRLPSSHTCFNQLDLPEYEGYEALRHQVYTAMTAGSEYFGFA